MAEAIDTAYVDIRPDFTGFAVETERGIKTQLAAAQAASTVRVAPTTGRGLKNATGDIQSAANASKNLTKANNAATQSAALLGGTAARSGAVAASGIIGIGVAAALATTKVATASIAFETAFSGVRKTVSATRPQLAQIRDDLLDLSTTIPVTAVELANIAEAAGQLGVSTPAIKDFTRVVAELGVTTNLTSDEAADALARIANITQLPQDQFENLGSTVVALGNKMAATESEIVDFGRRIAGAGKQVGLSVPEILGIGSALASVGIEAEAGGSSISTTIATMAKAVASGGKKLQGFADIAGVSANKFADEFRTKPAAAITRFIEGIARINDEGGNVFTALEKIGLGGIRVRQTLLNASGAGDLLAKSLNIGTTAFERNTALQREAGIRFQTTASNIQLLRNEIDRIAIAAGDKLKPALGAAAGGLRDLLRDARGNKSLTEGLNAGFEALSEVVRRVFDVFRDNKQTIRNVLGDLASIVRTVFITFKPLVSLIAVEYIGAMRLAIPVVAKLTAAMRFMAETWTRIVGVVITGIDKFLGGLSTVAGALSKLPRIGDKFKDAQDGIDTAREHLRDFSDDLQGIKDVNAKVTLELPTAELDAFITKLQQANQGLPGTSNVPGQGPTFGVTPLTPPTPKTPKTPKDVKPASEVPKAIAALEQGKQDQLALAQARTKSLADDRAALQDLAAFYDEQANNMKLDEALRRGFLVKAEQARGEVRNIDSQITATIEQDAETRARNAVAAADATSKNHADDLTARRRLIGVLRERVASAKAAGEGVASAQAALGDAERDLVSTINQQRADRIDVREEKARAAVTAAQATEKNLQDDINAERKLIGVMRKRVEVAKATKTGVQAALANLKTEENNLTNLLRDQGQKRADARLDAIEDAKQLASFTEGKGDDKRALQAEERFWKGRVAALKKSAIERRKAFVQLQRTRKDIRDLTDKENEQGGPTVASILTDNAKLFSGISGNIGKAGIDPLSGFDFGASLRAMLTRQAGPSPTVNLKQQGAASAVEDSSDALIRALDRLTDVVAGNVTTAKQTGGTSYADVVGMRYNAMARFWESRQARVQTEDSTSG